MIQTTVPQPKNARSAVIPKVPTPAKRPVKKAKEPHQFTFSEPEKPLMTKNRHNGFFVLTFKG
jgi:hypothetical protein